MLSYHFLRTIIYKSGWKAPSLPRLYRSPQVGGKLGNVSTASPPPPQPPHPAPSHGHPPPSPPMRQLRVDFAQRPYLVQQSAESEDAVDTCSFAFLSPVVWVFSSWEAGVSFSPSPGLIRSLVYCTRDLMRRLFITKLVSPVSPLKQFQCLSDWQRPCLVLSR